LHHGAALLVTTLLLLLLLLLLELNVTTAIDTRDKAIEHNKITLTIFQTTLRPPSMSRVAAVALVWVCQAIPCVLIVNHYVHAWPHAAPSM
jgi:hypothetical protein